MNHIHHSWQHAQYNVMNWW